MNPNANKIRSRVLAAELGVSLATLERWARREAALAGCRWKRGWWDVTALRAAGFLQPQPQGAK